MCPNCENHSRADEFWNPSELGCPQFRYTQDKRGWRWFMALDGDIISDSTYYPSQDDARRACAMYRIGTLFNLAESQQCDCESFPPQYKLTPAEIENLSQFVKERLHKHS